MQHLARVLKKAFIGGAELEILARQISEHTWELMPAASPLKTDKIIAFNEGALILVKLSWVADHKEIEEVRDATEWVLEMISQYLTKGLSPDALNQEVERAEQWRQSLTLQNQEVSRRALETLARRDEIQELEKKLKLDREELEQTAAELKARELEMVTQRHEIQALQSEIQALKLRLQSD
ncbi:hypothetical protein [Sphaerothrix gracilis]|uniref:hypothetical protein n=1 Tax=Sphaerothrix gracilis TaxID=3151835 RepID=UPI0031FD1464